MPGSSGRAPFLRENRKVARDGYVHCQAAHVEGTPEVGRPPRKQSTTEQVGHRAEVPASERRSRGLAAPKTRHLLHSGWRAAHNPGDVAQTRALSSHTSALIDLFMRQRRRPSHSLSAGAGPVQPQPDPFAGRINPVSPLG